MNLKSFRRAVRRPFESFGFILIQNLIPMIPRRILVSISNAVGFVAARLPLRENTIALANMDAVFGNEKSEREKRIVLQHSLGNFCQTMLDVFWFSHNPKVRIPRHVKLRQDDMLDILFTENRPLICITAHFGSWELLGQTAAFYGCDLASIAAPIKNPVVNDFTIKQRQRTGQTIIERKGAVKALLSRLRKKGKTAFVLDQNTSLNDGGIMVKLLGLPTPISPVPASMAYRTGTDILIGYCRPDPKGDYLLYVEECITPPPYSANADHDQIIHDLTQVIEDTLSAEIRKYPQNWLWAYRHWRRDEPREYPTYYPNYQSAWKNRKRRS